MTKLLVPLLLVCFSPLGLTARAEERTDERLRYLASRLDAPIGEIDKGEVALPFLLGTIARLSSVPEAEKNPAKMTSIVVNVESFKQVADKVGFDPERITIKFINSVVGASLGTILDMICEQIDAGYVVRNDFIEIMSISALRKELERPNGPNRDLRNLVVRFYENIPLETALNDLSVKYGRTVLLSPLAEKEVKKNITAKLINVPFDMAVETLADLADLKLVRKSNVILVTTKEQAGVLNAEYEKRLQAERERLAKDKTVEEKLKSQPEDPKKP